MENLEGKKAKIIRASDPEIVGEIVTILYVGGFTSIVVGFPKDSLFGWSHRDFPDYKCWYTGRDGFEVISAVTRSKFK